MKHFRFRFRGIGALSPQIPLDSFDPRGAKQSPCERVPSEHDTPQITSQIPLLRHSQEAIAVPVTHLEQFGSRCRTVLG